MRSATAVRWKLAWFVVLPATWIMSLDRTAMTVAAPVMQKDLHFTLAQMSWILTAFHWAYAICSIPAGLFTARAGARLALVIANGAWSVLTLAIPFAGDRTINPTFRVGRLSGRGDLDSDPSPQQTITVMNFARFFKFRALPGRGP